eukprot:UN10872
MNNGTKYINQGSSIKEKKNSSPSPPHIQHQNHMKKHNKTAPTLFSCFLLFS